MLLCTEAGQSNSNSNNREMVTAAAPSALKELKGDRRRLHHGQNIAQYNVLVVQGLIHFVRFLRWFPSSPHSSASASSL